MAAKILLPLVILILLPAVTAFAQLEIDPEPVIPAEKSREAGNFWLSPLGEVNFFSVSTLAYGGGFSIGYGKGLAVGLKAAFFASGEGTSTIELNFLLRLHFLGAGACSGPFIQLMGGPAIFTRSGEGIGAPSELGMVSAGLGIGWNFLIKNRWFIEPVIRGGYPYIAGAGLSAGMRF